MVDLHAAAHVFTKLMTSPAAASATVPRLTASSSCGAAGLGVVASTAREPPSEDAHRPADRGEPEERHRERVLRLRTGRPHAAREDRERAEEREPAPRPGELGPLGVEAVGPLVIGIDAGERHATSATTVAITATIAMPIASTIVIRDGGSGSLRRMARSFAYQWR